MKLIEGLSENMNRVLNCVAEADDPITASEVTEMTQMNPDSVRVYLRRLDTRGLITRPYRGQYVVTKMGETA